MGKNTTSHISSTPEQLATMSDSSINSDEAQLRAFGYKQVLHRSWGQAENICASFCALYFVGGIRYVFSVGIAAGGAPALWSSWLVTVVCSCITAAMLAEVCSSIPLSGSIYIWAAECGGKKWGRLAGFIVAFWSTTAWTSFLASINTGTMNYLLSELVIFEKDFPGGIDMNNIKFRAVVWIGAELFLWSAVGINMINPRTFRWIFFGTAAIMMLDWLLTLIWLPIGVSQTYGFQDSSFFTETFNGTGAPTGWNWLLSFLFTSGVLTGFDASGHVAEETKNASLTAARGIFWSCFASAVLGTPIIFLFLACSPNLDVLYSLNAPQPFVLIYSLALGKGGQLVMTIIAILGLWLNTVVCIIAASRLVFAIARDGVLPGSKWIGKVKPNGQPKNAILFTGMVAGVLLLTILPSPVAFTSLVSAGAMPTIAAYALIPFLRLFVTPGELKTAKWSNGRFSTPFLWISLARVLLLRPRSPSPLAMKVTTATRPSERAKASRPDRWTACLVGIVRTPSSSQCLADRLDAARRSQCRAGTGVHGISPQPHKAKDAKD